MNGNNKFESQKINILYINQTNIINDFNKKINNK